MLTLTPTAGAYLQQLLETTDAPDGSAVRLVLEDRQLKMTLDTEKEEDTALAHDEKTVLVLGPEVAELLDARTLDVAPTPQGEQLVLQ